MKKTSKIGLFGYGCVGQGLHDVLNNSKGFKSGIETIVVKNKNKKRRLSPEAFKYDKQAILDNQNIDLVVELIDDAEEAFSITKDALKNGKNVVSANKKMIAEHFQELVQLQQDHQVGLLYEASACGSIPIIRTLEEYYDNELLESVSGIFNGSSNYILSKVINEGLSYEAALTQAQVLGFAESDPTLDVEGYDAKYKLVIVTGHAYGLFVQPEDILNLGINHLSEEDIEFAKKNNYHIKLVATTSKLDGNRVCAYVSPTFIEADHPLSQVQNEYNGVIVEAAFSDQQLFIGKGAGGHPTGSAVLSDISANSYNYRYEYKKSQQAVQYLFTNHVEVDAYLRYDKVQLGETIQFNNIQEQTQQYTLGSISLNILVKNRDVLNSSGAFLSIIGKPRALHTAFKKRSELITSYA